MAQGGSGGIRQFIGLTGEEEVRRAFKSLGDVGEQAFRDISRAADASARNVTTFGRNIRTAEAGVNSLSRTVSDALSGLSAFKAGLGALAGAAVVRGGFNILDDTLQKMRDLRNASVGSGAPMEVIAAFQQALADAGSKAQNLGPAFIQAAGAIADARKEMKQLGNAAFPNIAVMKGSQGAANQAAAGMRVLRGATEQLNASASELPKSFHGAQGAIVDVSTPFKALEIDVTQFGTSLDEQKRLWQSIISQYVKISKIDPFRAARAGALILGEDDITKLGIALKNLSEKGLQAYIDKARETGKMPDPAAFKRLDEYDEKVAGLTGQWDKLKQAVVFATFPLIELELKGAVNLVKGLSVELGRIKDGFIALGPAANQAFAGIRDQMKGFGERTGITAFFSKLWTDFTTQGTKAFVDLTPTWDWLVGYFKGGMADPWKTFQDAAEGTFNRIMAAWDKVATYLADRAKAAWDVAKPFLSAPGGVLPAPGLAAGGMVRGPGTGTSDSVLARLSAGEFVMKTAAVDHWGPRFMHALNNLKNPMGFAEGGLVGLGASLMPPSGARFAEGGLAATEAGTPIHLHFPGGGQVQLHGDKAVVRSLLREARRAGMVSAGRPVAVL